jgi:hypothetical protein
VIVWDVADPANPSLRYKLEGNAGGAGRWPICDGIRRRVDESYLEQHPRHRALERASGSRRRADWRDRPLPGGHNAIVTALFESRIKAIVSSCGFNAFPYYNQRDIAGWSHKGYMPRLKKT